MANKCFLQKKQKPLIDMSLNIWLLRVFGLLGLDTTAAWKHVLHHFYSATVVVSYIIILTANVAGMFRDWGDFDAIINNICLTLAVFSSLVKYFYFIFKRQDIELLLRTLWEFENYRWPQCLVSECSDIITKTSRYIRAVTLALSFFVFLIFWSWTVSPFISARFSVVDPTGWRSHPFMGAFFFDYQSSPNYEAIYCFQSISLFSYCFIVSSFDTVCVAFFMQVSAQFRVLLTSLRRLREVAEESLANKELEDETAVEPSLPLPAGSSNCRQEALKQHTRHCLSTCIKHHNDIIEFAKKVDDVFNPIMLAQILYSMFEIAVSGLQATESSADFGNLIKFVVFTISLSFELYLFCRFADVVLDLSQEVATAAYSCEWYDLDPQIKTMLQIVIMRAQSAVKLTAFRFRVMSLDTYGTLLNGAYTYFALLKEAKKEKNYQWPPCVYAECSNIITKTNYDVRIMTRAVTFFIFLIFLSWTVSPVATAWISGVDPTGWRPHPFLAAFFFDYQSSPNYELVYCFQVVLLFFFCMGASSFDAVCVAFFMQVAGQFRILQTSLRRLQEVAEESLACSVPYSEAEDGNAVGPSSSIPDGSTDCRQEALKKHALQHLKYSIKHHNDIIMFVKKLDDVLNPIMLAELLYSMSEIAISGLQATESSADFGNLLKFLVFAVSLSLELYFFCQYADILLDLSQDIAITAYSSEWYKMDPQIKTMLQIVIMRAQKPVKVTAFHFKVMSMDTYGALLNGAYTYFALLKEIKKGK